MDFCFANLAAFKLPPSPDWEFGVTCGGPSPALPPTVSAPSLPQPGLRRGEGKETIEEEQRFMNSLHSRPLRSVKSSPLPLFCPIPQHPDTHFLVGHTPAPPAQARWSNGKASRLQPTWSASPSSKHCQSPTWECLLAWQLGPWASWERAGRVVFLEVRVSLLWK